MYLAQKSSAAAGTDGKYGIPRTGTEISSFLSPVIWCFFRGLYGRFPGVLQLHVSAVEIVVVAAFFGGDQIHVLKAPDVVRREKPVAYARGVALNPGLVVAAKQPVHVELREHGVLFLRQQQVFDDGLLEPHEPGRQRMHHEIDVLPFYGMRMIVCLSHKLPYFLDI